MAEPLNLLSIPSSEPLAPRAAAARRVRPSSKGSLLTALLGGSIVAALALATYTWLPKILQPVLPAPRLLTAHRRPMGIVLHEHGAVAAHIERPVLTRFAGEITWRAEDGTLVEAGEPIVMFDSKTLQDDIDLREKDLQDKQDAVRAAKDAIQVTKSKYTHLLRQQEINLAKAELDNKKAVEFPLPDDLLDVELTWKSAQKDTQLSQLQTDALLELFKLGFASEVTLKQKQLELANAKADESRSKMIYDLTRQGTTADLKRVAELAVADARKSLNVTVYNRDSDIVTREAALELAKITLRAAERDLERRKMRLDAATVRAPMRGRVIFHNVFKGSDKNRAPIQVGETRQEGAELCMLLDTSNLVVSLWVNEMDIGAIQLKQTAQVLLPALPDLRLQAEVSEIAVTAQDKNMAISPLALHRSGEAFVNVVKVTLAFSDLPEVVKQRIRVGFTADVKLEVAPPSNAVCVPWQAIGHDTDGSSFVEVQTAGLFEHRTVKLGRSDAHFVEVDGVKEGTALLDRSGARIPLHEKAPGESEEETPSFSTQDGEGTPSAGALQ